jgi:lon-related putative ATP-dependent protease
MIASMSSKVKSLPPESLRYVCDPGGFPFETTSDLTPSQVLLGQPRVAKSLEFGIGLKSKGYNIYVLGSPGTSSTAAICHFIQEHSRHEPVPDDWVYVHNFEAAHRPLPIRLPAGRGAAFQQDMKALVESLRIGIPQAFESFAYRNPLRALEERLDRTRHELLDPLERKVTDQGFDLQETPGGLMVTAADEYREEATNGGASVEEQQTLRETRRALQGELQDLLREVRRHEREAHEERKRLDREAIEASLRDEFDRLRAAYADQAAVVAHLDAAFQDLQEQVVGSASQLEQSDVEEVFDLRRYEVNLLVDNSKTEGAPVVVQLDPTHENLFGRLEFDMHGNMPIAHFTRMKPGDLHRANGGYLILCANDFARQRDVWEVLKQALRTEEIELRPPRSDGPMAAPLWPQPIPCTVKVVLLGSRDLYYSLYENDEEFHDLFKVRADFSDTMPRDAEHELGYAEVVAALCAEDGLRPFDRTAVGKVIEFGSRVAEHQRKLTARLGLVTDLVREANYWAGCAGHAVVSGADVQRALDERVHRTNEMAEQFREAILEGRMLIATEGYVVGQVNGLSIHEIGDFAYGHPGRITARTFMGDSGVIHIERETDMSGPIHQKGVLTLNAYLGGTYAQHQPLSLNASLTFEQYYGGIEGDSASSTELYALLSSLSQIPIDQGISVTGSVNQRGEIQPIGGVNDKIEGFFDVCKARGLNGRQGVIIPEMNTANLMLREDVVQAVAEGRFRIWPVSSIDEGIELLMGTPAGERNEKGVYPPGTVHYAVQQRLLELALELKSFGDSRDESGRDEAGRDERDDEREDERQPVPSERLSSSE